MSKLTGKARAKARKLQQKESKRKTKIYSEKFLDKILKFDNPILKEVCSEVSKDDDLSYVQELRRILCFTKKGVGLSASQIGVTKKLFILRLDPKVNNLSVVINPEIIDDNFVKMTAIEGCLSYPGFYCKVERPWKIEVKYLNERFTEIKKELIGYEARVFLHEYDHLLGECIVGEEYMKQKKPVFEEN